jgi:hypothetical protein
VKRLALCVALGILASGTVAGAASGTRSRSVVEGVFIRSDGPAPNRFGFDSSASENWAGYVQQASSENTFTSVTDSFNVPTLISTGLPRRTLLAAADWVGIGGYTYFGTLGKVDATLIQAGIQAQIEITKQKTRVSYYAWTETLPQYEKPLHLAISPGDLITATVTETGTDRWLMEVQDVTTGKTKQRLVTYDSSGLSAEAIHERPCTANPCDPSNLNHSSLAPTSDVTFDPGYTSLSTPGTSPVYQPLLGALTGLPSNDFVNLNELVMQAADTDFALPSAPNAADDGFTVADGSQAPPPPDN